MNVLNFFLLSICSLLIATGQLLFKRASNNFQQIENINQFAGAIFSRHFVLALAIYSIATMLWIWLLREIPLTRAYPFIALSFVIVPLLSFVFLGETVGYMYFVGLMLILAGICVVNL